MIETFHTVGKLRSLLAGLPDDTHILCQVKGQDSPAVWMMYASLSGPLAHFKWSVPVICLSVEHPDLKVLPPDAFPEAAA